MNIYPIHTEADYNSVLNRIEEIFDAKAGTPEGDELEILGILVDKYEKLNFLIEAPVPIEALKLRMDQLGLSQSDFAQMIGSISRASEILSGKRSMSLRVIRVLNRKLNIPAEILIQQKESVV